MTKIVWVVTFGPKFDTEWEGTCEPAYFHTQAEARTYIAEQSDRYEYGVHALNTESLETS